MAGTGSMTAGFVLSAVLVLVASCDAAPPRAAKAIAPPKPEIAAKAAAPQPKSEPQIVAPQPSPRPDANTPARKTQPVRAARHTRHGSVAQNSRPYRYDGQPELRSRWSQNAERPMNGPVHEADRRPGRPADTGCDEACRYRAWLRDYDAWYRAYGQRYAEYPPAPLAPDAPSAGHRDWPRTAYRPDEARARSERDRLDPWHGYDGHDGPQNGY